MIFHQIPLKAEQSPLVIDNLQISVLIWPMNMLLLSILAIPKYFNHNLCPFNTV